MRKLLGTTLLGGSGALLLGLVPSLVSGGDLWKWVLGGLVLVGGVAGIVLRPWKESEADKKVREIDQAKIAAATQQELIDVNKELARLRHAQLAPTLNDLALERNGTSSLALGASSALIAAGRQVVNQQRLERELQDIEIRGLEEKRKALQRIVEGSD